MAHNQARSPKLQVPPGWQTAGECFPTPRIIQGLQLDHRSDARETRKGRLQDISQRGQSRHFRLYSPVQQGPLHPAPGTCLVWTRGRPARADGIKSSVLVKIGLKFSPIFTVCLASYTRYPVCDIYTIRKGYNAYFCWL